MPPGMVALDIPRCEYAVFTVPNIPEVSRVWKAEMAGVAASQWTLYGGTDCASHQAFQYYPPGYQGAGYFSIYLPVKRK